MSFFTVVSFDIVDGEPSDYTVIYEALELIGLKAYLITSKGVRVDLPETTVAGNVDGEKDTEVRDTIMGLAKQAFKKCKLHGNIFVSVSSRRCWSSSKP